MKMIIRAKSKKEKVKSNTVGIKRKSEASTPPNLATYTSTSASASPSPQLSRHHRTPNPTPTPSSVLPRKERQKAETPPSKTPTNR
jgi:hypothetical protein